MDKIDTLISEIVVALKNELPSHYSFYVCEFESLIKRDLLRASYGLLDDLIRKNDWHPSIRLKGLIDKYKVIF
jgi:hypothetical protein